MSHLEQFHYSILGTNTEERIVFVHGLMAFAANWRKIANRLENDFQCLIYDQRGHGRSFKPESGYSPEDFAEDIDKITTELGWDKFHLVGHSMGGRNVMVFANLYPHKVKTLTIEDMGPDADPKMQDYYKNMLDGVPTPFIDKMASKNFFENEFLKKFPAQEPPTVLALFLQANLEEKPNGNYDWRFSKKAILEIVREGHRNNHWSEISQFKMPVLLIRGEKSHLFKKETFDKMLTLNSNIQGVEIAGAGHWVHYEKYEEFTQTLDSFIQQNSSLHNA